MQKNSNIFCLDKCWMGQKNFNYAKFFLLMNAQKEREIQNCRWLLTVKFNQWDDLLCWRATSQAAVSMSPFYSFKYKLVSTWAKPPLRSRSLLQPKNYYSKRISRCRWWNIAKFLNGLKVGDRISLWEWLTWGFFDS